MLPVRLLFLTVVSWFTMTLAMGDYFQLPPAHQHAAFKQEIPEIPASTPEIARDSYNQASQYVDRYKAVKSIGYRDFKAAHEVTAQALEIAIHHHRTLIPVAKQAMEREENAGQLKENAGPLKKYHDNLSKNLKKLEDHHAAHMKDRNDHPPTHQLPPANEHPAFKSVTRNHPPPTPENVEASYHKAHEYLEEYKTVKHEQAHLVTTQALEIAIHQHKKHIIALEEEREKFHQDPQNRRDPQNPNSGLSVWDRPRLPQIHKMHEKTSDHLRDLRDLHAKHKKGH